MVVDTKIDISSILEISKIRGGGREVVYFPPKLLIINLEFFSWQSYYMG